MGAEVNCSFSTWKAKALGDHSKGLFTLVRTMRGATAELLFLMNPW